MLKIRNLLLSIMYNKKLNLIWRPAKNLFQWIDNKQLHRGRTFRILKNNKKQGETSETESNPLDDIKDSQCTVDELD